MSSTITVAYGNVSFSAAAENEKWLSEQFDKFLDLAKVSPPAPSTAPVEFNGKSEIEQRSSVTLASHLKAKGAETNQNQRFLATADWLRLRGNNRPNTALVTKALSDNHQKRLGNAAECLNQNVGKGFCEKTADSFFITPDGLKHLGYE